MPYLTAAVLVLAVLGMLNLLLTLAGVRRLRMYAGLAAESAPQLAAPLPAENRIRPFTAGTTDGGTVSERNPTLVGYFSLGCPPCQAEVPRFAAYAAGLPRERVLAVIVDDTGSNPALGEAVALEAVARVVVAGGRDAVTNALAAHGYPAVFLLDEDGRVVAADATVDGLPILSAR